jgi:hypothetical protein
VDSTAYGVQIVNNGENDNNDIRNNIIFNSTGNEINDLCGVGCSGTVTSPNLTTDPDFVDPGSDNYHLLATSDARDAGDDLNAVVVTDHDGVALDDTPDEGAFQFVTGGALTSAPIHIHPRVIR